jgi:hypothetical protein
MHRPVSEFSFASFSFLLGNKILGAKLKEDNFTFSFVCRIFSSVATHGGHFS